MRARPLLGTLVEVEVDAPDREAHRAIDLAFEAISSVQSRMSFHDPASALSRLNQDAARKVVCVDAWTYFVLQQASTLFEVSKGLFDVSIAPKLQALGFLPPTAALKLRAKPPSFADVELLPDFCVRYHHPGLRLDLGGIAKGFAVDQAIEALRAAGITRGLVNAGGDLRTFGTPGFPVSIRNPNAPGSTLASVTLCNNSLATSAHYFADRLVSESSLGPIIHPQTGQQASGVCSATVRAGNATIADALTKIVMLAGEAALPILDHYRADALFVDRCGEPICSSGWHATFSISNQSGS